MEKEKNVFEEELVKEIKTIEKFLTPEEKEDLYQKALKISNDSKALDELKEKVKKIETFYENLVDTYNKKVDEMDTLIETFDVTIDYIEKRIIKEKMQQCTTDIKPLKLDITKDEMNKLDTNELSNMIESIFKELMK